MNEPLRSKLELFSSNAEAIKKSFPWQNTALKRLAALLYASRNKCIDNDAIRECYDLIKKNTKTFSTFRGNSLMTLSTLLSLSDNKEELLAETLKVYQMLKAEKFRASDFLVIAAWQVVSNTDASRYTLTIKRAKAFYDGLKNDHRFLTGYDDYIFAVMLGLSDIDVRSGLSNMERLFISLKPHFSSRNGLQALTQVLVLGGDPSEKESDVLNLCNAFKKKKLRLDKDYTLSSLGVLSLLPVDTGKIVNDVNEAYEFLRAKRGFGAWSITKQELLLLSSALVSFEYLDQAQNGILTTAISTSITNIIIAQQAAVCAAVAASSAAASSSST